MYIAVSFRDIASLFAFKVVEIIIVTEISMQVSVVSRYDHSATALSLSSTQVEVVVFGGKTSTANDTQIAETTIIHCGEFRPHYS